MTTLTKPAHDAEPRTDLIWQTRIDALTCGAYSEEDFMDDIENLLDVDPDSARSIIAFLNQRYQRGQLPEELFRSIESRITQRELEMIDSGITINLDSVLAPQPLARPLQPLAPPDSDESLTVPGKGLEAVAFAPAAATAPWAGQLPAVGSIVRNRYVLENRLGSGGMGTVFKALDRYRCDLPEGSRHVAIKFLHGGTDSRDDMLSNLRREFHSAQALSHPNIVKVYELDCDDDGAYFTMELLEGELLSSVLGKVHPGRFSRTQAWSIILQVAEGIAHAHAHHVVHRDLKPHNIMITRSGDVRILDFGASNALGASSAASSRPSSSALTPAYASCELIEGREADPRDDLYALACLSYELLAGEHPFKRRRSTEARALGLKAQPPAGLSRRQWQALATGLAWSREDRSISVREWIHQLIPAPVLSQRSEEPSAPAAAPTPKAKKLWLGTAALVIVLVVLLGWAAFRARHTAPQSADQPAVLQESAPSTAPPLAAAALDSRAQEAMSPDSTAGDSSLQDVDASAPADGAASAAVLPAPDVEKPNKLSISSGAYRIGAGQHFAEIHVRRSSRSAGVTSFAWWTEPSSAMPGTDFVPQARVTQFLPSGRSIATLFVKILPNASRNRSAVFFVVIGEPSDGTSLGRITRTSVRLPPY
jgi:serine/threonine protein kinase